jgi:ABC-type transport system substrate-binding protein
MQRRALIQATAMAAAGLGAGAQAAPPAAASALRVLRLAIPTPETTLDPVQTNSDQ